jgi:hypothetical protein
MVRRIKGTIIVVGEMNFKFQISPFAVPTAPFCIYCLASSLFMPCPSVTSIFFGRVADSFSISTRMNSHLQMMISVLSTMANQSVSLGASDVFKVVSHLWDDARMTLPYPSICRKPKLSSVDKRIMRTKKKVVVLP